MFELAIETDNAAFDASPADEIARILRLVADRLECGSIADLPFALYDINGGRVGSAEFSKA